MKKLPNWVSCDWLMACIDEPELVVLDATLEQLPNGDPVPVSDAKIPGARRFNYDTQICAHDTELPHMLPTLGDFQDAARELGIKQNSIVVIYDQMGNFASPRGWWMCKVFGLEQVYVLDGGLPQWQALELPVGPKYAQAERGDFIASFNDRLLANSAQVMQNIKSKRFCIVDARSYARFNGSESEPRPGLRSGHIPGSLCLPFDQLLETNGCFRPPDGLMRLFRQLDLASDQELIFTCGSGVTACVLAIVADQLGFTYRVYDGSWAEWGADQTLPVAGIDQ